MSFPTGHALLIGVGSYIHHEAVTNLPTTVGDVRRLAALLTDPTYCGYPHDQVTVLHDDQATRAGVLAALDHLAATTTADSTVLIYYAGHGHYDASADTADRTYFLTTHETDLTTAPPTTTQATLAPERWIMPDTAISQVELLSVLQRLPAQRVLLIFNACHAGELHPTMSLGDTPAPSIQGSNPPEPLAAALLGTGSGRVILTACQDSQVSQAGPGPTTIFAEYLLAALQGQDVPNRKGTISVFDLYMTVYEKVKARVLDRYYRHQEPVLTMLGGIGPFPIALYQGATNMGIADDAGPLPDGDTVRLISIQQSQQALTTLLSRMDGKLDQLSRQIARLDKPATQAPDPRVQAQALLDAMPIDMVPDPTPIPPFSRMPYTSNPYFVGRNDALLNLAQSLKGGGRVALGPRAAATGLGGIGKTSVAAEFVHRYGQYFAGGVFWLSFSDPAAVAGEVAICGGPELLNLHPAFDDLKQDQQVRLVRQAWQQETPRLLVFDNCEDPRLVEAWAPPTGGCRILITSRHQRWPRPLRIQSQRLDILARVSSIDLLKQLAPHLTESEANTIAAEMGDLPLALQLAGSYLNQFALTPVATYLAELTSDVIINHPSLQGTHDEDVSLTRHDRHVGRSFLVSYQHLDPNDVTDAGAIQILMRAACLAPSEPIPLDLLLATADLVAESIEGQRALQRLLNLALLTMEEDNSVHLHRLVQAVVQAIGQDSSALMTVETEVIHRASAINAAGYPNAMAPLLAHLRWLVRKGSSRIDSQIASLYHELAYNMHSMGDYRGARPLFERALEIREQVLGPMHPSIAQSLHSLGRQLDTLRDFEHARLFFERALAIHEHAFGPNHALTAHSLNLLAGLMHTTGNSAGARPLLERALEIHKKVLGLEHSGTAITMGNLALVISSLGEYDAAESLMQQALAIDELVLGPNHPATAISLSNLAALLYGIEDYIRARPLFERALAINETEIGVNHPITAITLCNLANVLYSMRDPAGAQQLWARALAINEQALGSEHPTTDRIRTTLLNANH